MSSFCPTIFHPDSLQPCLVLRILWPWKPTILTGTRYLLSHPRFCLFHPPMPRSILLLRLGEFSRTLLCRGWEEAPYTNNTRNMVSVIPFPHPLIHVDELSAYHVSPLSTTGFLDLSVRNGCEPVYRSNGDLHLR